jgi:hypothetical protein
MSIKRLETDGDCGITALARQQPRHLAPPLIRTVRRLRRGERLATTNEHGAVFKYLPLSIRLETLGGVATPLVLRGTPLPAKRSEVFSTAADNQSSVELSLWLGESPLTRSNIKLGTFYLKGIPAAKVGEPKIAVEFSVDQACAVVARANLHGSDLKVEEKFGPPSDLSEVFVQKVLAEAEKTREEDEAKLRHIEAVNRSNRLIKQAEERLAAGPNSSLNAAIAELGLALASGDSERIREKADALEQLLSPSSGLLFGNVFGSLFSTPPATPRREIATKRQQRPRATAPAKQDLTVASSAHVLGRIFGGGSYTLDSQLCFVLMPFSEKLQPLYDDHIRPIIQKAGLRCERVDAIRGTTLITHDIWEYINRARFLVAEVTDRNANVFYELGLAHALSKDVILLTQSMDSVPFDLKALRCLCYEFTPRGVQKLEAALAATIDALIKVG